MTRPRSVPDDTIFAAIRDIIAHGGDRAATFAAVGARVGLSGASLVQRYGSRERMVQAAMADGWNLLDAATFQAEAEAPASPEGAAALLKSLGAALDALGLPGTSLGDKALAKRAAAWQARVETALALRLGATDAPDAEGARILFAAWQGRRVWAEAGRKGPKLREIVARIAGRPVARAKP